MGAEVVDERTQAVTGRRGPELFEGRRHVDGIGDVAVHSKSAPTPMVPGPACRQRKRLQRQLLDHLAKRVLVVDVGELCPPLRRPMGRRGPVARGLEVGFDADGHVRWLGLSHGLRAESMRAASAWHRPGVSPVSPVSPSSSACVYVCMYVWGGRARRRRCRCRCRSRLYGIGTGTPRSALR